MHTDEFPYIFSSLLSRCLSRSLGTSGGNVSHINSKMPANCKILLLPSEGNELRPEDLTGSLP